MQYFATALNTISLHWIEETIAVQIARHRQESLLPGEIYLKQYTQEH